jgi:hypothetical protein
VGWWETHDGLGLIGDRPADLLGGLLRDAFGESFDVDLFAGFLAAFAAALMLNPAALVSDPPDPEGALIADFAAGPPLVVPLRDGVERGMLERDLYEALDACAFHYRLGPERLPRLAELLETLEFVAAGRVTAVDGTTALELVQIRFAVPEGRASARGTEDPITAAATQLSWGAMRALATGGPLAGGREERLVAGGLRSADWRVRMTAVLIVGRLKLEPLSEAAAAAAVPELAVGLRDEDRGALLALRDAAVARAASTPWERPIHPDPVVAGRRAALRDAVSAVLAGDRWPEVDGPAAVIRALAQPDSVLDGGAVPPPWQAWLRGDG